MKDSRYKEIMVRLGMPNSRSLLCALQQVANEVEQEVRGKMDACNHDFQTMSGKVHFAEKCNICGKER